MKPLMDADKR